MLGTCHESVHITNQDIVQNFPDAIFHAEVPAFRSAFVPMFLLSKLTQQAGIKVVLSGEGADEAFLGYDIFKETTLRKSWTTLSTEHRRNQLAKLYPHLDHYGPQDLEALSGLYQQFSTEQIPGLFSHELRFQNGRFCTRLLNTKNDPLQAIRALTASEPNYAQMTPIQKAQWLEFRTLLPGYLLSTQGDRMSLAHGVENRCPFLDPAVLALACSVNLRFDDGFEEKHLLRKAFQGKLPESVIRKRKFPYRAPDSSAFSALPPAYLEMLQSETELSKIPYLDSKFARLLTKKILTTSSDKISTKENQAFIFLISMMLLNKFFIQRDYSLLSSSRTIASPFKKAVDMRSTSARRI
jgi:asparagine synthase (glutamine-hydrolysing)